MFNLDRFFSKNKKESAIVDNGGYLHPLTASALLKSKNRETLLKQIRQNTQQTDENWQRYFLPSLQNCVSLMQRIPFTVNSKTTMTDHMLTLLSTSMRLSRGVILQKQGSAEDKAKNASRWNAVIFYAALFHYLPSLSHFKGELLSGKFWQPGTVAPKEPYRVKNKQESETARLYGFMAACSFLPGQIIGWLAESKTGTCSPPLDTLLRFLNGDYKDKTDTLPLASLINQADCYAQKLTSSTETKSSTETEKNKTTQHIETEIISTPPIPLLPTPVESQPEPLLSALDTIHSEPLKTTVTSENEKVAISETLSLVGVKLKSTEAEQFLDWLTNGIKDETISINQSGSILHITGDYLFVRSPAIFYFFLKNHNVREKPSMTELQKSFEKLSVHTIINGKGVFSLELRRDKNSRIEKTSGYLIKLTRLFQDSCIPYKNSEYLSSDHRHPCKHE